MANQQYFKYTISSFQIIFPKNTISRKQEIIDIPPEFIKNIEIEKDFDNDIFPVFRLVTQIQTTRLFDILKYKTDVKFRLRLDSIRSDNESSYMNKNIVIDTIFSIYINDDTQFMDRKLYETNVNTTTQSSMSAMETKTTYEFYLFKETDLTSSKSIINAVISSSTLSDALLFLFNSANIKNILMSPLDNIDTYNEITLLPISLIQNINYLNIQYGFYNHGMSLFFDFNRIYFIDQNSECTAYEPQEFTTVFMKCTDQSSNESFSSGSLIDYKTKSCTVYIPRNNIRMTTASIISDQLSGNNITTLSPNNEDSTDLNVDVKQHGEGSSIYMIDTYNNPYSVSALEYRKKENDCIIEVSILSYDMNIFTPNKKFIFDFTDSTINNEYSGEYRLCYIYNSFDCGGQEHRITGSAIFKRIK